MLDSVEELKEKLKAYEYEHPEPLSRIPSVALRQAVADLHFVVQRGAVIDMGDFGSINGQCRVCLAGAVLLARGYYGRQANKAVVRRNGAVDLWNSGIWADSELNSIAAAFDHARLGLFVPLLHFCGVNIVAARELQQQLCDARLCDSFAAAPADDSEELCSTLLAVADFLKARGV